MIDLLNIETKRNKIVALLFVEASMTAFTMNLFGKVIYTYMLLGDVTFSHT